MTSGPVLAAEITGRAPRDSLRVVSTADFKTGEWRVEEPIRSPGEFIPYCLDLPGRRSFYVKAGSLQEVRRAKLQYVHLRERATTLLSVPWERGRLSAGPVLPVCFVFSVGRCGSTLLAEAMRSGGVLSLSEPDFYTQAVAMSRHASALQPQFTDLAAILGNLTADLLDACGGSLSEPALIKLRTQCCRIPDRITAAQGSRRVNIFMIRDFASWAMSTLRASARTPQVLVGMYMQGLECLKWLRRTSDCHLLCYEDLVSDSSRALGEVAQAMNVAFDSSRLKAVLAKDAQSGTALARKRLAGRRIDRSAMAGALDLWARAKPRSLLQEVGLSHYC